MLLKRIRRIHFAFGAFAIVSTMAVGGVMLADSTGGPTGGGGCSCELSNGTTKITPCLGAGCDAGSTGSCCPISGLGGEVVGCACTCALCRRCE